MFSDDGFESTIIQFSSLAKSDPDGIIAGTDTATCDAFGNGKKNTYIFNPNIGSIVIQELRGEKWKTLSQATITIDQKIDNNINEVIEDLNNGNQDISNILDESILKKEKSVLSLDSIEGETDKYLKQIWGNGVFKFLNRMAEKGYEVETGEFIQGSYQGLVLGSPVENNYLPSNVMAYSDNSKKKTNLIRPTQKKMFGHILKDVEKKEKGEDLSKGVSELDSSEVWKVAYLEGKAYKGTNLQEYLFTLSNMLIGKEYEGLRSGDMSFKYENQDGKMEGYLIAYEANFDDEGVEEIPALYIADLAALPESKLAGGRLIQSFVSQYMEKYIEKGNMIPIVTHARDKTSYQIITKQLDKIASKYDLKFEMKEINNYAEGDNVMHSLVIYPEK